MRRLLIVLDGAPEPPGPGSSTLEAASDGRVDCLLFDESIGRGMRISELLGDDE